MLIPDLPASVSALVKNGVIKMTGCRCGISLDTCLIR
jgi:hypothetical protein